MNYRVNRRIHWTSCYIESINQSINQSRNHNKSVLIGNHQTWTENPSIQKDQLLLVFWKNTFEIWYKKSSISHEQKLNVDINGKCNFRCPVWQINQSIDHFGMLKNVRLLVPTQSRGNSEHYSHPEWQRCPRLAPASIFEFPREKKRNKK